MLESKHRFWFAYELLSNNAHYRAFIDGVLAYKYGGYNMAVYGITAVRYDKDRNRIEQVRVHNSSGSTIEDNYLFRDRQFVVTSIENGHSYWTFFGKPGDWTRGAKVEIITVNGVKYLRTDNNKTDKDNLESLPDF